MRDLKRWRLGRWCVAVAMVAGAAAQAQQPGVNNSGATATAARPGAASAPGTASGSNAAAATPSNSMRLAPGFSRRSQGSRLVVVPADMELFSMSAGGVLEPKADWTQAAQKHFRSALAASGPLLGPDLQELADTEMDEFAQLNALHGAVAEAVFVHHMAGQKLPTKDGKLDWSLGDAVQPLRDRTGADYALFFWIRDSYASSERKAAMVALALFGVGITGGAQIGYASLVDLRDGRVVWFNNVLRASGDLREELPAKETLEALLKDFPSAR